MEFGACPQCQLDISPERKLKRPVICNHCGFTSSNDEIMQGKIERRSIVWFSAISVFVIAAHIQLSNWDKHSLSIIPLGVKSTLGMMSQADHEHKAEICIDLKKWDCVETSYVSIAKADSTQWQRAADFQMKRAKYAEAAQSYYQFFQNGGESLEASYSYAKALAQLGQVDEATQYFDQVLASKPDVLQVTVVQSYVKLLMDHQRYDQAKVLIDKVRAQSGVTGEQFMDEELNQIKTLTTASRE